MTAIRVITDHKELENSGVVTHSELDEYVGSTTWVVLSGSSFPSPPAARKLKADEGVVIVDNGPSNDLIIKLQYQISWNETLDGPNDGVNKVFFLQHSPSPPQTLMLFINGVKQFQGPNRDYIITDNVVSLLRDYESGDVIDATYQYQP